jgi:aryl-alcohol dehydrogenase-like predicted oxidoreductase
VPAARALGVQIVAYSPLGRGMLSGAASATTRLSLFDYRRMLPRWQSDNLASNLRAVETVADIATDRQATPAQVALSWLLAQGDDIVPIPGTKRPGYVEENIRALQVTLTDDDMARLDRLVAAGDRYPSNSP